MIHSMDRVDSGASPGAPRESAAAPPGRGAPRNLQQIGKPAEQPSSCSVIAARSLRGRRAAGRRLAPFGDGPADPLDDLAEIPVRTVEYGTYDVVSLGLNCPHGESCPARRRPEAV